MKVDLVIPAVTVLLVSFVLAVASWWCFRWLTPASSSQATDSGAGARPSQIVSVGFYLGYVVSLSGSFALNQLSFWAIVVLLVQYALVAFGALAIAHVAFDSAMQCSANSNLAVAIFKASGCIALGFVLNATFAGATDWLLGPALQDILVSIGVFVSALFGLCGLYVGCWKLRGRWLIQEIASNNSATALQVGSAVVSLSITLWFIIVRDAGLTTAHMSPTVAGCLGIVLLGVGRIAMSAVLEYLLKRFITDAKERRMKIVVIVAGYSIIASANAGLNLYF